MTRAFDEKEDLRRRALSAFLDARVLEGYRVETRTDTHAIIGPAKRRRSFLQFRKQRVLTRQVLSVDGDGVVTTRPAEPLRS